MLDVSDGLLADLGHICEVSRVGAVVRAADLPLSPAARAAIAGEPELLPSLAAGGDDYELLFAAPPESSENLNRLAASIGVPITRIGAIEEGQGVRLVDAAGREIALASAGYRHF
jgi:thiamine-monophosphate kinase